MKIDGIRKDYKSPALKKEMLNTNPFKQFEQWFTTANNGSIPEPNAMTLATVSPDGQPTLRTVLLKLFDEKGFVFFTNFQSSKARQIEQNPKVALLFPWITQERQVSITGIATKISTVESAKYFATRPHESQLGAWISQQSSVISSRNLLRNELDKIKSKFLRGQVPLPDFWGGFRVQPLTIEFWQGRTSRLHDRFLYTKQPDGSWNIARLAP